MENYYRFSAAGRELEAYLSVLYTRYRMMDLRHEWVIRGVLKPRFAGMRHLVESYLKNFNGRYNFERVGDETYLTISATVSGTLGAGAANRKWLLHLGLFVATVFSTMLAGALREGGDPLSSLAELSLGIPFAAAIMTILLVHELGHYFAARHHGMDVTLPFFIPMPPPMIFGTMGALIKMRSPMFNRRMLLDVGAAGPIAGFVVSVPVLIIGLMQSDWTTFPPSYFVLGDSLLFGWLTDWIMGPRPEGMFLNMSSLAFAGWIGFFVTAMNLMPIGQLDGGHIGYALLGKKHGRLALAAFAAMICLSYFWPGWLFWGLLILLLIRVKHPPVLDEAIPLDRRRRLIGAVTMLILLLTFMPRPILA
ncbi:MAG: site-2 protease family protein [Candidatus Glassbacteria bacterium]|nr:site-2 protease family protein [Candidatus Glassbacteria bacterium]